MKLMINGIVFSVDLENLKKFYWDQSEKLITILAIYNDNHCEKLYKGSDSSNIIKIGGVLETLLEEFKKIDIKDIWVDLRPDLFFSDGENEYLITEINCISQIKFMCDMGSLEKTYRFDVNLKSSSSGLIIDHKTFYEAVVNRMGLKKSLMSFYELIK